MRDEEFDDMENISDNEETPGFLAERPVEELAAFQSAIYNMYFPIDVEEQLINDDISHRNYYGICKGCDKKHFLGTLVQNCYEPIKLYVRVK